MDTQRRRTPILLLPFVIVWSIFSFLIRLMGRLIAVILGLGLVATGLVLTLTFFAAPIGIPLVIFGILLLIRSIF